MAELGLAIAGLAVSAPPIIVPILQCINYIRGKLSVYKTSTKLHQDQAISAELHLLSVENLAAFVQDSFGDSDHLTKMLLLRAIKALETTLIDFTTTLSTVIDARGNLKRLKFTFRGRDALSQLNQELREWEHSLNNVLFFMVLARGQLNVDTSGHLRNSDVVRLIQRCLTTQANVNSLQPDSSIGYTNATPVTLSPLSISSTHVFEEHRSTATVTEVSQIANFLNGADPQLIGLLRCSGFQDHVLRYDTPNGFCEPRSLKRILVDARGQGAKYPLEQRLMLMKRLASALMFVHCGRRVHKSIRLENVVLFSRTQATLDPELGHPFLVGFALSRLDAAASDRKGFHEINDMYHLPVDRQGDPQRDYSLLDDIYSLGVVFLEIALWQTFTYPGPSGQGWEVVSILRGIATDPQAVKETFLGLAKKEVPRRMGSAISELIVSCLSAVDDPDGFTNGSNITDADVSLGIAYVKRVLLALDTVHI